MDNYIWSWIRSVLLTTIKYIGIALVVITFFAFINFLYFFMPWGYQ